MGELSLYMLSAFPASWFIIIITHVHVDNLGPLRYVDLVRMPDNLAAYLPDHAARNICWGHSFSLGPHTHSGALCRRPWAIGHGMCIDCLNSAGVNDLYWAIRLNINEWLMLNKGLEHWFMINIGGARRIIIVDKYLFCCKIDHE